MNKKTVALTEEQYKSIIKTIRSGFICADSHAVKPNNRIATALVLEANLGLRISDVLQLRLSAIIHDGNRYRLDIVEQKTKKKREFTVPIEIYSYIQNYVLENNINPAAKLFIYQRGQYRTICSLYVIIWVLIMYPRIVSVNISVQAYI